MPESGHIQPVSITDELSRSYLDYAMSVIVGRALPDVRDGLKPVHRRVLFAMNELRNTHTRPYVKSARVVGEVIGKYHPHGDAAVYDAIVRLAQSFSMRMPLVDGQGNFGSVDGDPPAAQRYTEVRMTGFASTLLEDLDRETVDFTPNYDNTLYMPDVLPNRVPNLLINGSTGIAVGMATNIPPHNAVEIITACLALLDDPELSVDALMEYVHGPDFPTGAIINGRAGIQLSYRTGRGSILIRSKADIITNDRGGEVIVIHEIPYQVNKAEMIEKIAMLARAKKLEGIAEIRDESDKDGLRIVIEVRRADSAEIVLNQLYAHSNLEKSYGINLLALVGGQPRQLNLKQMLEYFLLHRKEIVTRRTRYLLRQARSRGHVLEGQAVALSNINTVVALIKGSSDLQTARTALMAAAWSSTNIQSLLSQDNADLCRPEDLPIEFGYRDGAYHLSEQQAQSILELRLHRLARLEHEKLFEEYGQVVDAIINYKNILSDPGKMTEVIRAELQEVATVYDDKRRTVIMESQSDLDYEDLIEPEDRVVVISRKGYAKASPASDYQTVGRGGRGRSVAAIREEDFIRYMLVANTHDTILCFSNIGKVYWLKVYQIRTQGRTARGRPLVNLLKLAENEHVTAFLPVNEYSEDKFIFMATTQGIVKRTPLSAFARRRKVGLIALGLDAGNSVVEAAITDGNCDIVLISSHGQAVRFKETDVRSVGRTARGVRGIRMAPKHSLVSMLIVQPDHEVLMASENGYGKRTSFAEFGVRHRGGLGTIAMRTNKRNGALVDAMSVLPEEEVIFISEQGRLVRTSVAQITVQSRRTQGVRLINLYDGERLIGMQRIAEQQQILEQEAMATDDENATDEADLAVE